MLRLDLICLTNSGISSARMTIVSPTIDSAHEIPEESPNTDPNTEWNPSITALTRKYSGRMMKPKIWPKKDTQTP